ncbi:hypothetical protein ACIGQ5_22945, partial [Peribacillus frigoritolerans]|uniref:hypothetical protein n=1 Tax=Peribacillus frigoritolerans TaxID=450367 RepID=UPI0037C5D23C
KRVPGVEINVQIVQAIKIDKLDFHRVCLQSETDLERSVFCYSAVCSITLAPAAANAGCNNPDRIN